MNEKADILWWLRDQAKMFQEMGERAVASHYEDVVAAGRLNIARAKHLGEAADELQRLRALPPLRAREDGMERTAIFASIPNLISRLRYVSLPDQDGRKGHFAALATEAANVLDAILSSTAGQEWLAFDPAKLSDSELILCLEEMRRRDAAALPVAEPLLAERQTGPE